MSINNITPSKFQCAVARCTLVLRFSFTLLFSPPSSRPLAALYPTPPPLPNRGPISTIALNLCPDFLNAWPC